MSEKRRINISEQDYLALLEIAMQYKATGRNTNEKIVSFLSSGINEMKNSYEEQIDTLKNEIEQLKSEIEISNRDAIKFNTNDTKRINVLKSLEIFEDDSTMDSIASELLEYYTNGQREKIKAAAAEI